MSFDLVDAIFCVKNVGNYVLNLQTDDSLIL